VAAGARSDGNATVQVRLDVPEQLQPGAFRIDWIRAPAVRRWVSSAWLPATIAAPPASLTSSRSVNDCPETSCSAAPSVAGVSAAVPFARSSVSAGNPALPSRIRSGSDVSRGCAAAISFSAIADRAIVPSPGLASDATLMTRSTRHEPRTGTEADPGAMHENLCGCGVGAVPPSQFHSPAALLTRTTDVPAGMKPPMPTVPSVAAPPMFVTFRCTVVCPPGSSSCSPWAARALGTRSAPGGGETKIAAGVGELRGTLPPKPVISTRQR
jgi:hypothetical protein